MFLEGSERFSLLLDRQKRLVLFCPISFLLFVKPNYFRFCWFILVSNWLIKFPKVAVCGSCPPAAAALARAGLKILNFGFHLKNILFSTVRQKTGAA